MDTEDAFNDFEGSNKQRAASGSVCAGQQSLVVDVLLPLLEGEDVEALAHADFLASGCRPSPLQRALQ